MQSIANSHHDQSKKNFIMQYNKICRYQIKLKISEDQVFLRYKLWCKGSSIMRLFFFFNLIDSTSFLAGTGTRQSRALYLHDNPIWTQLFQTRPGEAPSNLRGRRCTPILQMLLTEDAGGGGAEAWPWGSSHTSPRALCRKAHCPPGPGRACSEPGDAARGPWRPERPPAGLLGCAAPQGGRLCSQTSLCLCLKSFPWTQSPPVSNSLPGFPIIP